MVQKKWTQVIVDNGYFFRVVGAEENVLLQYILLIEYSTIQYNNCSIVQYSTAAVDTYEAKALHVLGRNFRLSRACCSMTLRISNPNLFHTDLVDITRYYCMPSTSA